MKNARAPGRTLCFALPLALLVASALRPLPVHGQGAVLQILPADGKLSAPPVSLTASDGTGLRIVSLKARAVVEDPLAFTELHLTFHNPQPRQIEGQFEITLPEGAAISRFAMHNPQGWQEGEVVELQAAREAYEDFLHRRQDPALLEKQAGNQFHARVFPIPPSGDKEIIVSFSQERPRGSDPYRIFLRGLPKVDLLDIRAVIGKSEVRGGGSSLGGTTLSHQTIEVHKTDFTPDVDFQVPLPAPPKDLVIGLRHENLVVARVTPLTGERPEPIGSLLLLFDTSASRALGFAAQVERLGALVAEVRKQAGAQLPLRVLCFDQEVEEVFSGRAGDFGPRQLGRILSRRALGASDLGKALALAVAKGASAARVVLFTDGIATAGMIEGNELRKGVQKLRAGGVTRLDAIAFGGIRDEALLGRLVTAGLPSDGVVIDGELPVPMIARKLGSATVSGIKVSVPGSQWVWPTQLDGVQPGTEILVYADLPRDQPFEVVLDGAGHSKQPALLSQVQRPLLERAWIGARIRKLLHQRDTLAESDQDLREGLKHQIVELSTRFRVLSDFTALLVLETDQDYARFHIDRRALSDILTVGPTGIELLGRTQPAVLAREETPVLLAPRKQPFARDDESASAPGASNQDKKSEEQPRERALRAPKLAPVPQGGPQGQPLGALGGGAAASTPAQAPAPIQAEAPAPPRPVRSRPQPSASTHGADAAKVAAPPANRPSRGGDSLDNQLGASSGFAPPPPPSPPRPDRRPAGRVLSPLGDPQIAREPAVDPRTLIVPYEGKLLTVMNLLKGQKRDEALRTARSWRDQDPGDVLALVALGEALEALGQRKEAARAYGSLIDLFPGRADVRRFAGERLERLLGEGLELAIDTYRQARAQRPDHPASHRLLAYALLKAGQPAAAFDVITEGARRDYPAGRFAGVHRILTEDAGLIAAAWLRKEPQKRPALLERLSALSAELPTRPSLRFVLNWETDANDVDFHIFDSQGGHAFYSQRQLPTGGELYADVTTGYGPECFTIEGPPRAYPYKLQAHYYSRGPMGYGMGKLEIIEHDGKGGLRFAERPFVIMVDNAFVDLGLVKGPLQQ